MVCDLHFNKIVSLKCIIHYVPMYSVSISKTATIVGGGIFLKIVNN